MTIVAMVALAALETTVDIGREQEGKIFDGCNNGNNGNNGIHDIYGDNNISASFIEDLFYSYDLQLFW